jgi:hypothetical protein
MTASFEQLDDDAIRALVKRLSRRHSSGGEVIERAAILAEGAKSAAILAWIEDHDWVPEEEMAAKASPESLSGIHGMTRTGTSDRTRPRNPSRYVLAPGAGS